MLGDMRGRKSICARPLLKDGSSIEHRSCRADDHLLDTRLNSKRAISNFAQYVTPQTANNTGILGLKVTTGNSSNYRRGHLQRTQGFRRSNGPLDGRGSQSSTCFALVASTSMSTNGEFETCEKRNRTSFRFYFLTMTMTSLWDALFYHRNDYTPRPTHGKEFCLKGQKNTHGLMTL